MLNEESLPVEAATTAESLKKKKAAKPEVKLCPDGHEMCESCGECHECEEIAERAARKAAEPATQKAKGLRVLQRCGWKAPAATFVKQEDQLKNAFIKARSSVGDASKPVFARPCPVRPRHGFVESRPVMTQDEAHGVFLEARKADPEAEMILSPMIAATHNMLWRPGLLAVGPKHDGATAGKDSIGIPLLRLEGIALMGKMLADAEIAEGDDPYIEAVVDKDANCYFTQLRSGSRLESLSEDFIPEPTLVKRIVEAEGDLLEWEAIAEKLKGEKGVVVWHPGGTLASHFSVHCIQRRIPIVTTKQPIIGETLQPQGDVIEPPAIDAVIEGLCAGTAVPMASKQREPYVCSVLTGLHHSAAMQNEKGFFLGVSAAAMIRLGYAAAIGESRHAKSYASGHVAPIFDHEKSVFKGGLQRSQIYEKALTSSVIAAARPLIPGTLALFFAKGAWGGGGYGGPKWGECTKATIQLDNAICALLQRPSRDAVIAVASALNNAVNQAHNNGWWLNKFARTEMFDKAVKGDPQCIIPSGVLFYEASKVPSSVREAALSEWRGVEPIDIPKALKTRHAATTTAAAEAEPTVTFKKSKVVVASAEPTGLKKVVWAQCKQVSYSSVHIQYKIDYYSADGLTKTGSKEGYATHDVSLHAATWPEIAKGKKVTSLAGGTTPYHQLKVVNEAKKVIFKTFDDKVVCVIEGHFVADEAAK